jgi:hypothetical protein
MTTLTLGTYRSKGINAYLVPLHGLKFEATEIDFGRPATNQDKALAHKSKAHNVSFDMSLKADGYYRYKEASGHKVLDGWILIQDGDITRGWDTEEDYAVARANASVPDLPALEGTERQVAWATKIRAMVIVILGYEAIDNWAENSTGYQAIVALPHSKDWIENNGGKPAAIAQSMINSWS